MWVQQPLINLMQLHERLYLNITFPILRMRAIIILQQMKTIFYEEADLKMFGTV